MKECRWADDYKAIYPPRCGDGTPCDVCQRKWERACLEEVVANRKETYDAR